MVVASAFQRVVKLIDEGGCQLADVDIVNLFLSNRNPDIVNLLSHVTHTTNVRNRVSRVMLNAYIDRLRRDPHGSVLRSAVIRAFCGPIHQDPIHLCTDRYTSLHDMNQKSAFILEFYQVCEISDSGPDFWSARACDIISFMGRRQIHVFPTHTTNLLHYILDQIRPDNAWETRVVGRMLFFLCADSDLWEVHLDLLCDVIASEPHKWARFIDAMSSVPSPIRPETKRLIGIVWERRMLMAALSACARAGLPSDISNHMFGFD